jgi:hypothetical protein
MGVIAVVVREAGPGQVSARRNETEDRALGHLVPADIEGTMPFMPKTSSPPSVEISTT